MAEKSNMGYSADLDVVIIGAGFAGLAAADRLNRINGERASNGLAPLRYVILEGSARAGGRTKTEHVDDIYLDFGGQYLAPPSLAPSIDGYDQAAVHEMVARFGVQIFDTYLPDDKDHVYQGADGRTLAFRGNFPGEGDPAVQQLLLNVEGLVKQVRDYVGRPWEFPGADALDAFSVSDWLDREVPEPTMRELFDIAVRSAFSVEPDQCSLLHFLHYAASCGSFAAFENVKGGGDAIRFRFGTYDLIERLLSGAGKDRVFFKQKVVAIQQTSSHVEVNAEGPDGARTWLARRVIVAMSPSAAARVQFYPALSEGRQALTAGMPMAHTIKGFAIFQTKWWREKFSGYVLSALGPVDWVMDNTWVDQEGKDGRPCMMTFIVGQAAIDWGNSNKTPGERQEKVLNQLAALFDVPRPQIDRELIRYVDFDWGKDPWGKGCPAGCVGPGVLTQRLSNGQRVGEALYRAEGLIHWAGSETGLRWMGGYMNGAIDSGIRVAKEVAALL